MDNQFGESQGSKLGPLFIFLCNRFLFLNDIPERNANSNATNCTSLIISNVLHKNYTKDNRIKANSGKYLFLVNNKKVSFK